MFSKRTRIITIILSVLLIPAVVYTFSSGPPDAKTGAPGESTCIDCHTTFPLNSGSGTLKIENVPVEFIPMIQYPITIKISQNGQKRWGFELKTTSGTILVTDSTNTQLSLSTGTAYLKHTSVGTYADNTSGGIWTFNWQAPSAGSDTVIFYAAGNAANNNGFNTGDYIYTTTATTHQRVSNVSSWNRYR